MGGNGCGKNHASALPWRAWLKPQRHIDNALRHSQAPLPQDPKALFVCDSVRGLWNGRLAAAMGNVKPQLWRGASGLKAWARATRMTFRGQQQKLALAKLLLANPEVLFLDEPTKRARPGVVRRFLSNGARARR